MTARLDVLVVDNAPESVRLADELRAAGHVVHDCYPDGATTCVGVTGECPLDAGIDVAVTSLGTGEIGAICATRAGVPVTELDAGASVDATLESAIDEGYSSMRAAIAEKVGWTLRSPEGVPASVTSDFARDGRRLFVTLHGPQVSRAQAQAACTRAYDAIRADRRTYREVRVGYRAVS